ncbi:MAG: sirohydrochlorin cobaltochelatase [Desulfohalobiaceae bacterium]
MALEDKKAIVIAGFGTSQPDALPGLQNILQTVRQAYSQIPVRLAFTSNTIRRIWASRADDREFWQAHPDLDKQWLLSIKTPLATLADLQSDEHRSIIVQPTHVFNGEEYQELCSLLQGLDSIRTVKEKWKPFSRLALGRPLLGRNGPHPPYMQDIEEVASLLAPDVQMARESSSALVYMGHGNRYFSTGAYWDLMRVMQDMYPEAEVFVCCASGSPDPDFILQQLQQKNISKALLKPLMTVAGDHAKNDMAGEGQDSLKSKLEAIGIQCSPIFKGLGQEQAMADKMVRHIRDAAAEQGIELQ